MVRKPTSGDSEQRERDAKRAREASQLSAAGGLSEEKPSNRVAEQESAHGALIREGIDSD